MAYQLIAFDMDGTLLDSAKEVLPSSAKAIADATAAGKDVVICSGRCPAMVEPYARGLPGVRYAIASSGAVLYDLAEKRVLFEEPMDPAALDVALGIASNEDFFSEAFFGAGFYYDERYIDELDAFGLAVYRPLYVGCGEPSFDLPTQVLRHEAPCVKLNMHFRDPAIRERILDELKAADLPLETVYSERASIELSRRGVSKGTGLLALSKLLGIDPAATIAVGDADNDLEALWAAGLGVAMGNANEAARAAAGAVVATNDEGGCAEAIYKYLLGFDRMPNSGSVEEEGASCQR